LGTCGGAPVAAPLAGRLRGLVRSGVDVPEGLKIAEMDPSLDGAPSWTGLAPRARAIAAATLDAVRLVHAMEAGQVPAASSH
ncbi:xanthine dehydrogenase, partial [Aquabacter sp. P-9]|nr:xanthine dehydrogenase [Aquabacter sp. P-9]